jgi:hypothetical protein
MNQQPSVPGKPNRLVKPPTAGKKPAGGRRRARGIFNFVLLIGIIAAASLFAWAELQRREAITRLQETEQELEQIRQATERRGSEVAEEVLNQVRQLMDVPTEPSPTVATIIDVEALRQSSDFYNKADNGDHLIITENRAILFDPDRKIILDVVPVSINQEQQQQIPEGQTPPDQQPAGESPAEGPAGQPAGQEPAEQPTLPPQQ